MTDSAKFCSPHDAIVMNNIQKTDLKDRFDNGANPIRFGKDWDRHDGLFQQSLVL